jgi:hypothetical protein
MSARSVFNGKITELVRQFDTDKAYTVVSSLDAAE